MHYDFDNDLKNEDIDWFKKYFKESLGKEDYIKTNREQDINGIDCYVSGKSVQCKLRNKYYNYDICIEYSHQFKNKKIRGWGWHKPTAEYLFYGWKDCFEGNKNACLSMKFNDLHKFFIDNHSDYKVVENRFPTKRSNVEWLTSCIFVPIIDLKKHFNIWHHTIGDKKECENCHKSQYKGKDMEICWSYIKKKWLCLFCYLYK